MKRYVDYIFIELLVLLSCEKGMIVTLVNVYAVPYEIHFLGTYTVPS